MKYLTILLCVCCFAGAANASGRVPMTRTPGMRTPGVKGDISVPYLTTGKSAFGAYSVAPKIIASPIVSDSGRPGVKPVFNLIFYGAVQAFGDRFNGATPRR